MKRSVEILIILLLYCQIRLSYELFSEVGLESLGIIMITFSSPEPLDQKKRQAVGGVRDHYVSCCYLAMNNGLLMCRRCFACAQCGPCLRWIPLKKLYRSNKNADLMIQQSLNSFCEIPWLSAWQFSYLFLPSTSACADNSFAYCL